MKNMEQVAETLRNSNEGRVGLLAVEEEEESIIRKLNKQKLE